MFVAPRAGFQYRHTETRQLVPAEGFEADPTNLDIDRALACGDLVEVERPPEPAPKASRKAKARESAPPTESASEAPGGD